ncbi:MAG: leucine-rich repeat protein [Eubacterium sp.]|nr:leucine-rich repeat protein [Eubacterium sp.]
MVDTNEILALKNFANIGNNNQILDWLDNSGNISLEKLQYFALFDYDGTEYRVVAIDLGGVDVEGSLDLSHFNCLSDLYCEDTGITSLNLSGCTNLNTLECTGSEITTLILPSNVGNTNGALSSVNCEDNHIDINIFTDEIIQAIENREDYELNYKHQRINAPITDFNTADYSALTAFANQGDNLQSLGWDLTKPGEWKQTIWKYDNSLGKYCLIECHFDCLDIGGEINLSLCAGLEDYSFSGSNITSVILPAIPIPEYAFYDCESLSSVTIPNGIESIGNAAFHFCNELEDVYYGGVTAHWDEIQVGEKNAPLSSANIHCAAENDALHTWITTSTVSATCTSDGTTNYECSICEASKQETIPALGHDYESETTAPTCTEQGYTVYTCTRCNDTYTDYISARGHTVLIDEAVAPTCTETGLTVGSHCSVCNTVLTEQEVIPALGHDYVAVMTAPTCTTGGYTTHTCTRCNDIYNDSPTAALGHTWSDWVSNNDATLNSDGTKTRTCSVCNESETVTELRNGWYQFGTNDWYYFVDGIMQTGWQKLKHNSQYNAWYYFEPADGKMVTGWKQISGEWYYFNGEGKMLLGWQEINNNWYYFDSSGAMQTGWVEYEDHWYYMNSNGVMQTGWIHVGNYWYYMNQYGAMKTGWLEDNGNWYYLNPSNGRMVTGTQVINGHTYYFNSSGVCQNPYNPQGLTPEGNELTELLPKDEAE